jgi:hypothetical protein
MSAGGRVVAGRGCDVHRRVASNPSPGAERR